MGRAPDDRVESLFAEALERPSEERLRFLEEACRQEPELLLELRGLVEAHERGGDFLEGLSADIRAGIETELETAAQPRFQIGCYRTLEVIGHGGMGAVYRARRVDGAFEQEVALKLPHLDMQSPQLQARFRTERQLLAQLSHPNIARLIDGGITEEGRPYFVMEYVEGRAITSYCRREELGVDRILRLFLEVIDAVSYLHRNLIVHRDLKPSNIFVDREGRVKLLDFGVAKQLVDEVGLRHTLTAERLLTPGYAAPEQLSGERVSTTMDVYSLGVVLYELLTGRLPHDRAGTGQQTLPPSAAARSTVARGERSSVAWRRIAGDLDNICLKALRPETERRYASSEQMGQDLERFLEGLPVSARPNTLGYRTTRFAQRHRGSVAAAIGLLVLLTAGGLRERGLRRQAQRQADKATAVSALLGRLISAANPAEARGGEVTVSEVLDQAEKALAADEDLATNPAVEAEVRVVLGETYDSLGRLADARRQFERAIELGAGVKGAEESTLRASVGLARRLSQIEPERAKAMLRGVVAAREQALGPADERTLAAKAGLSRVLRDNEDYAEALALDREILEQLLATLGPTHVETLKAMNSLAGVYYNTSRYEQAAELYLEALERARTHLGADHPQTLRFGGNLAAAYSQLGRYLESENMQREALESRLRVLGPDHHLTGLSLHNLGMVLLRQARYEEAEPVFRQALEARSAGGGRMAGYWYSKSFLADALRDLGREQEAETLYLETMAKQKELYGAEFPDTYRTLLGLAELRRKQRNLDAATERAAEARRGYTDLYGEEHQQVAACLLLLARIELERDHVDEAAALIADAVTIVETLFPVNHPAVIDARLERARIRLAAADAASALIGLSESVEIRVARLGPEHPESRRALQLGVAVSEANERFEEAAGFRRRLSRGDRPDSAS